MALFLDSFVPSLNWFFWKWRRRTCVWIHLGLKGSRNAKPLFNDHLQFYLLVYPNDSCSNPIFVMLFAPSSIELIPIFFLSLPWNWWHSGWWLKKKKKRRRRGEPSKDGSGKCGKSCLHVFIGSVMENEMETHLFARLSDINLISSSTLQA